MTNDLHDQQEPDFGAVETGLDNSANKDSSEVNQTNSGTKEIVVQENTLKTRRASKWNERIPKLVVVSIDNGTFVNCSMENKSKTITFKFDTRDVNPIDIANDLVRKSVNTVLLNLITK